LRDYAVVAGYLYVCLGVLVLYRTAILRDAGVAYAPYGFALIKALLLGKFALLGKAAGLGDRQPSATLLGQIARKVVLFVLLLVALSALEELATGWLRGRSPAAAISDLGGFPFLTLAADALVMMLVAAPIVATVEVARALGPGELMRLLRGPPPAGDPPA
jgi:hypothetical protein